MAGMRDRLILDNFGVDLDLDLDLDLVWDVIQRRSRRSAARSRAPSTRPAMALPLTAAMRMQLFLATLGRCTS